MVDLENIFIIKKIYHCIKWHIILILIIINFSCDPQKPAEIIAAEEKIPEKIDFNLHVKPILSDRCFACHGPDENKREANLRLDVEQGAFAAIGKEKDRFAIKPGKLAKSEIFHRITSDDSDMMMPPPESNLTLSDQDKAIIIRWIEQGAEWKPHWSFIPPEKPQLPKVKDKQWVNNEIDQFVLKNLQEKGVEPAPESPPVTLEPRRYYDLTGIPPTPEQVDDFLQDPSEQSYNQLVDKLLSAPEHAERLAMEWIDVARYADSHGYHADGYRMMWPWRDWVINAFRENMPYDQFITWQLAGDLLPEPSREQLIATAFHRNHPMTAEGGIVDEEYRVEYVLDRTNTTAKAFLGLTMECSRCHDHKYDPISQKEYYQFSAFFNNVDELGMTGDDGNAGPLLKLTDQITKNQLDSLNTMISNLEEKQANIMANSSQIVNSKIEPDLRKGLLAHLPLDEPTEESKNLANRHHPGKVIGEVEKISGIEHQGIRINGDHEFVQIPDMGLFEMYEPFTISVWIKPEIKDHYQEVFGNAGHKNSYWRGYEVYLDSLNKLSARIMHALPHNLIQITTKQSIPIDQWSMITLSYDGSGQAEGTRIYINGRHQEATVQYDNLYKTIIPITPKFEVENRPLRFGKSYRTFSGDDGVFTGSLDDIRVYDRTLSSLELAHLFNLSNPETQVAPTRMDTIKYLSSLRDDYQRLRKELFFVRKRKLSVMDSVKEIMIMKEMEEPRPSFVLDRGIYNAHKEQVHPATPSAVLSFNERFPKNRLGLAQWITSEDNPLTARVTVNRYWQMFFGKGIVKTSDDFGNQGDLPTHPKLLDWLAVDFIENGWDLRRLIRTMVTSATYKQSSITSPELREKDPENLWLARGPKHRLQAEMVRDNALVASGLLVKKVGGPSAKPYQPEGLWIEKGTFSHILLRYKEDKGDGLYRRSMYTFIKRTSPPPSMTTFDLQSRSTCVVKRQTTNTPLQALVLLNDPQFVEASRLVATRMQDEAGEQLDKQLDYGFRLLTSRPLKPTEKEIFEAVYQEEREKFQNKPILADSLLSVGEYPVADSLDKINTAALTVVASLMMNHDEAYMKR